MEVLGRLTGLVENVTGHGEDLVFAPPRGPQVRSDETREIVAIDDQPLATFLALLLKATCDLVQAAVPTNTLVGEAREHTVESRLEILDLTTLMIAEERRQHTMMGGDVLCGMGRGHERYEPPRLFLASRGQ